MTYIKMTRPTATVKWIRGFTTLMGICALVMCVNASALAQSPRVLKISDQWASNDFRTELAHKFASEVSAQTGGALKFQVYPGSSLYKPHQEFDALVNGTLDMTVYGLAHASGKLPAVGITLMPALIESYKQAYNWEDAPIGKWLYKYLYDHGAVIVSWIWQAGGSATRERAVVAPADTKGLKTRGAGRAINRMLQAAGGAITPLPSSAAYTALQTGVLDSIWTSSGSLISYRLYEVTKYVTTPQDHTFWYMFEPLLMSRKTYDSLTPKQQKIVKDVGRQVQTFALESAKHDDARLAAVFKKAGDHVSTMNAEQFAEWRKVAEGSSYKVFSHQVSNGSKLIKMAESVSPK